jgi:hypothetical protein
MASNEHKNLLDSNRHKPLGTESADNNTYLGKLNGVTYDDRSGALSWSYVLETFILSEDGALATNSDVDYMRIPYDFRLTAVRASVLTAGSLVTVDIQEEGVSILSTLLTIDATEKTSTTAVTPVVISDYALADDAEVTIDLTIGGGEAPIDLKVYLIGYRTT